MNLVSMRKPLLAVKPAWHPNIHRKLVFGKILVFDAGVVIRTEAVQIQPKRRTKLSQVNGNIQNYGTAAADFDSRRLPSRWN